MTQDLRAWRLPAAHARTCFVALGYYAHGQPRGQPTAEPRFYCASGARHAHDEESYDIHHHHCHNPLGRRHYSLSLMPRTRFVQVLCACVRSTCRTVAWCCTTAGSCVSSCERAWWQLVSLWFGRRGGVPGQVSCHTFNVLVVSCRRRWNTTVIIRYGVLVADAWVCPVSGRCL